jgi:hypothetical protein
VQKQKANWLKGTPLTKKRFNKWNPARQGNNGYLPHSTPGNFANSLNKIFL